MTRPVIYIQWDISVKEAESMMTRYGVNVLPVLKEDQYAGLISREIVEKALFHGFGKSRAMDFSTPDAITVDPQAPIRNIETLMIEQNQRFMPVVEHGKIVGAITRTDLLRTLYEEFLRRRKIEETITREKPTIGRNLSSWFKEKFPPEIHNLLRLSGEVAKELGFSDEQIKTGLLAPVIGNTYAGASPIGLTAILDAAKAGDRILMLSYGSGAGSDALDLRVTKFIEERQKLTLTTADYIARRVEIDYATYARYRDLLALK